MLVPKDKILLRQDENGIWIAKSALLPNCHAYGETEAQAILEIQEAARAHLEALLDFGKPIPKYFRDKFVLKAV
jgi:predicted RNase H-like HicB family nuclease